MLRHAPKSAAKTISRIKPSTRLHKTASPTTLVAFVLTRRVRQTWARMEQASCESRKLRSAVFALGSLGREEALVDERSHDQDDGDTHKSADAVELVEVAQVVEE